MAIRGISFNYKACVRLKQSVPNSAGFQYQMEINFREQGKLSRWFLSLALFKQLPPLQVLQAPVLRNQRRQCGIRRSTESVLGRSNRTRVKGWNNNFRGFFIKSYKQIIGVIQSFPPVFSSFIDWLTALRNKYTVHTYPNIMETVVDCQTVGRH